MRFSLFSSIALTVATLAACSTESSSARSIGHDEARSVGDIVSMVRTADGTFQVTCSSASGTTYTELVTSAQILANDVCNGGAGDRDCAGRLASLQPYWNATQLSTRRAGSVNADCVVAVATGNSRTGMQAA